MDPRKLSPGNRQSPLQLGIFDWSSLCFGVQTALHSMGLGWILNNIKYKKIQMLKFLSYTIPEAIILPDRNLASSFPCKIALEISKLKFWTLPRFKKMSLSRSALSSAWITNSRRLDRRCWKNGYVISQAFPNVFEEI